MVNAVNQVVDPMDERLKRRIAGSTSEAERLSWTLERHIRPGWAAFIREQVMSHANPPTVGDALDAIANAFARLTAEAIANGTEGLPEPEESKAAALAFCFDSYKATLENHLSPAGKAEIIATLHRLNG